ncbi:2-oxoacid:acceptor oxidoreductase subunit alpha [bacterium]|nr:2-oxoacid:acceptor oxidoreductase subunit alpha [bacterium]
MNRPYDFSRNEDISIIISGAAGQGIKTAESLITAIIKRHGLYCFSCREYMSRVRGGLNSTQVRVSADPVAAWRDGIDILIPLTPDLSRLDHRISDTTLIIGDPSLFTEGRTGIAFSFDEAAGGDGRLYNTAASGLILALLHIDFSLLSESLNERFANKSEKIRERNLTAARAGYEQGGALLRDGTVTIALEPSPAPRSRMIVSGTEAVGLGALAGGCSFISSYPMSPGTGVFEFLSRQADAFPLVSEQAEDEIAALNMALGAWYAGARGMVSTSGGGFALMGEALSLAGVTETPAVIHIAQRPGPATGMATRTEQGDLNLALHAGHGDVARVIFAPGNPDQAFRLTARAFSLADEYQIPVIILTDQYLVDARHTIPPWEDPLAGYASHIVETGDGYQRYRYTESGISPRGIPGFGRGLVRVDSHEHDENGRISEDWRTREKMVQKRMKRLEQLAASAIMPSSHGNPEAATVVVSWGSTLGTALEALGKSGAEQIHYLHFSQVYPLNPALRPLLQRADRLVVAENNHTGQFADLLAVTFGRRADERLLQVNGFPFSVEYLTSRFTRYRRPV